MRGEELQGLKIEELIELEELLEAGPCSIVFGLSNYDYDIF